MSLDIQRERARGYSRQAFQPSGGASTSPFGANPYRFEALWYMDDSFAPTNAAHVLDRVDNDNKALMGKC